MQSKDSEWIEIVPAQPFSDADARFTQWLIENGIERVAISNDDVRIDTVRTDDGSARRYLIKRLAWLDLLAGRPPE
ncbi:MAG TPA: hypothetical protein DEV93_10900 [Chloroflexi bacterium]|nr:hypothetical protein [Chloroflexota bacterium]